MSSQRPFRLAFFSYLEGDLPPAEIYRQTLEIFTLADRLGFDAGWVAQRHFGGIGTLPSPLVFFAALAARTAHIDLGTGVIALPLEHPVRLAEDAAVFEALFPGRLHLGVGTGLVTPATATLFAGAGVELRHAYEAGLQQLRAALGGEGVTTDGDHIVPTAPALLDRIWETPASEERMAEAARRGSGALLSRVAIGGPIGQTDPIQRRLVDAYLANLPAGVAPRLGLSRSVFPSRDPEAAYRSLRGGVEKGVAAAAAKDPALAALSMPELFDHYSIHHGTSAQVIASLAAEPLLGDITELVCQVQPGVPSLELTLEAVELIATEVAPALGWRPAHARQTELVGRAD